MPILAVALVASACATAGPSGASSGSGDATVAPTAVPVVEQVCDVVSVALDEVDIASLEARDVATAAVRAELVEGVWVSRERVLEAGPALDVRFNDPTTAGLPSEAEIRAAATGQGVVVEDDGLNGAEDLLDELVGSHPDGVYVAYAGRAKPTSTGFEAVCADGRVIRGDLDVFAAPLSGVLACEVQDLPPLPASLAERFCP